MSDEPITPDDYTRLLAGPLGAAAHEAVSQARLTGSADRLELFFNPADVDGIPTGVTVLGLPVRRSIGVPVGDVLVFDADRGRYLRRGEQPS